MAEWEANKEEEEKEDHVLCLKEEDQEEVVEVADEGELLVTRRVMSGLKGEKEEQRENLFHSRCTVQETLAPLSPSQIYKHNILPSETIDLSPSKVLHRVEFFSPKTLNEKPSVEEVKHPHDQVTSRIEKSKTSYQAQAHKHKKRLVFQPADLVWVNVRKERFSFKRSSKWMPREDGPFEILARVNDHAYKIYLPGDFGALATFNVADLSPHLEDDQLSNLRANSSQQGENDGDFPMEPHREPQGRPRGPRIRPKVKKKRAKREQSCPGQHLITKPTFVTLVTGVQEGIGPGPSPSL